MSIPLLFEDGYEYTCHMPANKLTVHFDYGRRFHEINMKFLHFHPFYEIYILLDGKAQHIIEGQIYEIEEFDIVFLKPYQLHKSAYYKNTSCTRLILSFDIAFFEINFPEAAKEIHSLFVKKTPIYRFSDAIKDELISRFNAMYIASKDKTATIDFLMTSYFMQFFTQMVSLKEKNTYSSNQSQNEESASQTSIQKIQDIVSYIHQNYANELTLEFLADNFYISQHYLSRKFKQVTQFSVVNYIQQTRVKRAQELLLNTDLRVTRIMELCGFGSLSQFNRVFSSIALIPPSEYRKQNKYLMQQNYK